MKTRFRVSLFVLSILTVLIMPVAANDWTSSFRYNGFLTQGYIKSSDNSFFGDSRNGSFEFTEIALNGSVKPMPNLLLSGQLMMRNAGKMYDPDPAVDYALADFNLSSTEKHNISIAVGRLKSPVGFFNDTRDVAFTRPSIFLPQVIYFDQVRNAFLSSDGLMFNADFSTDQGYFKTQFAIGRMLDDENLEYVFLGNDWAGSIDKDKMAAVGRVIFETNDQRIRAAFSALVFDMDFNAGRTDPLEDGTISVEYYILSLEYNAENWWVTGEFASEPIEFRDFGPVMPDNRNSLQGYYVQANYRLRPDISTYLRYERGYLNRDDKYGREYETITGIPAFNAYAIGWSAGLRWTPADDWLLMADYQRVEGTFYLSPVENPDPQSLVKNWDMINLLVSYRF